MLKLPKEIQKKLDQYLIKSKQSEFIAQAVLVALDKIQQPQNSLFKKTSFQEEQTTEMKELMFAVYTDGGARGNPGPAGCGCIIFNEHKKKVWEKSKFIGRATNNEAEYTALLLAAEKVKALKPTKVIFYLDSELIVKQMQGIYKVKKPELAVLNQKIKLILNEIQQVKFQHIPRTKNQLADCLANKAMDRQK